MEKRCPENSYRADAQIDVMNFVPYRQSLI
jgi:hypothetical protein